MPSSPVGGFPLPPFLLTSGHKRYPCQPCTSHRLQEKPLKNLRQLHGSPSTVSVSHLVEDVSESCHETMLLPPLRTYEAAALSLVSYPQIIEVRICFQQHKDMAWQLNPEMVTSELEVAQKWICVQRAEVCM